MGKDHSNEVNGNYGKDETSVLHGGTGDRTWVQVRNSEGFTSEFPQPE